MLNIYCYTHLLLEEDALLDDSFSIHMSLLGLKQHWGAGWISS